MRKFLFYTLLFVVGYLTAFLLQQLNWPLYYSFPLTFIVLGLLGEALDAIFPRH